MSSNDHDQRAAHESHSLPREQIGPYFLLGVDKDASAETIEAHWAQRVIWARKGQVHAALSDINWAREVLSDLTQRTRADATSLNADTAIRALRKLEERYGVTEIGGPAWEPLDVEFPLPDMAPPAEIPDTHRLCESTVPPEVPWETPACAQILDGLIREPLDPWNLPINEEQTG